VKSTFSIPAVSTTRHKFENQKSKYLHKNRYAEKPRRVILA
jgi:hypothetical protein